MSEEIQETLPTGYRLAKRDDDSPLPCKYSYVEVEVDPRYASPPSLSSLPPTFGICVNNIHDLPSGYDLQRYWNSGRAHSPCDVPWFEIIPDPDAIPDEYPPSAVEEPQITSEDDCRCCADPLYKTVVLIRSVPKAVW